MTEYSAVQENADPTERVTLGIVDNDPLVLDLLSRSFAEMNAPIQLAWTAIRAEKVLEYCEDPGVRPQIILSDIEMPGMNGYELFRQIRTYFPEVQIIGISAFPDLVNEPGLVVLPKEAKIEEIVRLAGMLLHNESLSHWFPGTLEHNPLSKSELRTLRYYAQGSTTFAISHQLNVCETTVKTFVKRACKKLNVHSRTEAIVLCVRNNWI